MQRFDWFCLARNTLFFIESQERISTDKPHFAPLAPLGRSTQSGSQFYGLPPNLYQSTPENQARSMVLPQSLLLRH